MDTSNVIQIVDGIIGPKEPRKKTITPKAFSDYPGVYKPHLEIAKNYSSILLMGPPICDELIALIQHMYTEEEALLVRAKRSTRLQRWSHPGKRPPLRGSVAL